MIHATRVCALLLAGALTSACSPPQATKPTPESKQAEAKAPAKQGDSKESDAKRDTKTTRAIPPSELDMKKAEHEASLPPAAGPLTEEEQRLIDTDPKDLSKEERRKRAFALRKKIMQNPDSPQARELERIRKAVESGEVTPAIPGHPPVSGGLQFKAPNASSDGGATKTAEKPDGLTR